MSGGPAGGCLCGAVRFTTAAAPIAVRMCWCRACQYGAAGGPSHNAFFPSEQVTITGDLAWFDSMADSGTLLARGFCPRCGTPVAVQSHARRHLIALRVGTFDERDALAPQSIIWADAAPAWACLDPALPKVPGQPAPLG